MRSWWFFLLLIPIVLWVWLRQQLAQEFSTPATISESQGTMRGVGRGGREDRKVGWDEEVTIINYGDVLYYRSLTIPRSLLYCFVSEFAEQPAQFVALAKQVGNDLNHDGTSEVRCKDQRWEILLTP